ncbi:DUF2147 domain-containing protein [Hansschlegelia zhihuaiae]|nr:DUF2147 domain-containing protein [Hansschlegelia zhihuaiae]
MLRAAIHNADTGKRDRPIVGISALSSMKRDGESWRGQIYNPEDGETCKAYMTEQAADELKVQGCALGASCARRRSGSAADDRSGPPVSALCRPPNLELCSSLAK